MITVILLREKGSVYIYCKGQKISEEFFILSSIPPKNQRKSFPNISALVPKKWFCFVLTLENVFIFWFDHFLETRAEIGKKIVGFLKELKKRKNYSEIFWPLVSAMAYHAIEIWKHLQFSFS